MFRLAGRNVDVNVQAPILERLNNVGKKQKRGMGSLIKGSPF
jgi:hypothetical protein